MDRIQYIEISEAMLAWIDENVAGWFYSAKRFMQQTMIFRCSCENRNKAVLAH